MTYDVSPGGAVLAAFAEKNPDISGEVVVAHTLQVAYCIVDVPNGPVWRHWECPRMTKNLSS